MNARVIRGIPAGLAFGLLLAGCNEQRVQTGVLQDISSPSVTIQKTSGDTLDLTTGVGFTVTASDNLGLRSLSIELAGGFTTRIDSVFSSAVTSIVLPVQIVLPPGSTAGGVILITATAADGSGNGAVAIDSVFLFNGAALTVRMLAPSSGAVASAGLQIPIKVEAKQEDGVTRIGYLVAGVVAGGDSLPNFTAPFPDSTVFDDTLTVPGGTPVGQFTITGFAEDVNGARSTSATITVDVQTTASDVIPPTVTVTVADRVEVDDSITVRATDASGIVQIGWEARLLDGSPVRGDTTNLGGTLTDVTMTYALGFTFASLPQSVVITAHAVDGAGNTGTTASPSAPAGAAPPASTAAAAAVDTIIVVNGITRALPAGGTIADAAFNRNLNEIYLTNIDLDRLEIFQLVDSSFVPGGVPVGSQPWGIALWPRDTLGNHADSVIVANSGGTNLSIVDLQVRRESRRHALPNFLIQSVQTEIDQATGNVKLNITEFDFSDRPQSIGAFCRPAGGTACASDSVYAVYSTTPTDGQTGVPIDFTKRGTVRWENLTSQQSGTGPQSHFFWEQASAAASTDVDTLQIIVDRGPGVGSQIMLSAACGNTVDLLELAFLDTTFVRNSGNFTHALIGEGGSSGEFASAFARAIGYDGSAGTAVNACPAIVIEGVSFSGTEQVDLGISPAIRVRDFISNTAVSVTAIAVNFNGLTNLIRADSIYVLDEGLRLQGIVAVGGINPGMDLNFNHAFDARDAGTPTFGGTGDPNDRLVFSASSLAEIQVFDTFFYGQVAVIPIREPIVGPLRVALNAGGEQVLVGVTASGIVTVTLPAISNIFQAQALWGGGTQ